MAIADAPVQGRRPLQFCREKGRAWARASKPTWVARHFWWILHPGGGRRTTVDAACRLVGLLEQPQNIPALAPLIEREIFYRLLSGSHGATPRHLAAANSHLNQVSRAIAQIREGLRDQLRVRDIAAAAGMSESSLYTHFKAVTRMTPLEYQKQLRLQEARRLMLAEGACRSGGIRRRL